MNGSYENGRISSGDPIVHVANWPLQYRLLFDWSMLIILGIGRYERPFAT